MSGWIQHYDAEREGNYYIECATGKTQWDPPPVEPTWVGPHMSDGGNYYYHNPITQECVWHTDPRLQPTAPTALQPQAQAANAEPDEPFASPPAGPVESARGSGSGSSPPAASAAQLRASVDDREVTFDEPSLGIVFRRADDIDRFVVRRVKRKSAASKKRLPADMALMGVNGNPVLCSETDNVVVAIGSERPVRLSFTAVSALDSQDEAAVRTRASSSDYHSRRESRSLRRSIIMGPIDEAPNAGGDPADATAAASAVTARVDDDRLPREMEWSEMSPKDQSSLVALGWSEASWTAGDSAPFDREWADLSVAEQRHASLLGFDDLDFATAAAASQQQQQQGSDRSAAASAATLTAAATTAATAVSGELGTGMEAADGVTTGDVDGGDSQPGQQLVAQHSHQGLQAKDKDWRQMSHAEREAATILGWSSALWAEGDDSPFEQSWLRMEPAVRGAAELMGFEQADFGEDEEEQMQQEQEPANGQGAEPGISGVGISAGGEGGATSQGGGNTPEEEEEEDGEPPAWLQQMYAERGAALPASPRDKQQPEPEPEPEPESGAGANISGPEQQEQEQAQEESLSPAQIIALVKAKRRQRQQDGGDKVAPKKVGPVVQAATPGQDPEPEPEPGLAAAEAAREARGLASDPESTVAGGLGHTGGVAAAASAAADQQQQPAPQDRGDLRDSPSVGRASQQEAIEKLLNPSQQQASTSPEHALREARVEGLNSSSPGQVLSGWYCGRPPADEAVEEGIPPSTATAVTRPRWQCCFGGNSGAPANRYNRF